MARERNRKSFRSALAISALKGFAEGRKERDEFNKLVAERLLAKQRHDETISLTKQHREDEKAEARDRLRMDAIKMMQSQRFTDPKTGRDLIIEGTPQKTIEQQFQGLLVPETDVPGLPQVVKPGEKGRPYSVPEESSQRMDIYTRRRLDNINDALGTVDLLEQSWMRARAKGKTGPTIKMLGAKAGGALGFDPEMADYSGFRESMKAVIGRGAGGDVGNFAATEQKDYINTMPPLHATDAVAARQFQTLRERFMVKKRGIQDRGYLPTAGVALPGSDISPEDEAYIKQQLGPGAVIKRRVR